MVLISRCKLQTSMVINVSPLFAAREQTNVPWPHTHTHPHPHTHTHTHIRTYVHTVCGLFFINCVRCVFQCVGCFCSLSICHQLLVFLFPPRLMACMPHFSASICMNAEIGTVHVTLHTLYICIYCMYVYDAVSLKNSKCMWNGSALKLVTPGYKSVNQCTCMSAEDCRTEVLTLQQQRWAVGGMGEGGCGWTK